MKYLFDFLDALDTASADRHLVLMLDFDGTLAPIAPTPDEASIPPDTRRVLETLSKRPWCTVAVVSGRELKDVMAKVGIDGITYVGNHGLEIVRPGEEPQPLDLTSHEALLRRIREDLARMLAPFPGALIEDKGYSLAVHFRGASEEDRPRIKAAVHEAVSAHGGEDAIALGTGSMVLELRPPVGCDKGTIVHRVLETEERRFGAENLTAIYIGDDVTDEDAFKAIRGTGWTVLVGEPRISSAEYYLNDPGDVYTLLARFASRGREEG
jgi:trehalose-phosphatase